MPEDQLRDIEAVKVSYERTQDLETDCMGTGHERKGGVQADLNLWACVIVGWRSPFYWDMELGTEYLQEQDFEGI